MADLGLEKALPLGGYAGEVGGTSLRELDLCIVCVSLPLGEEEAIAKAVKAGYKVTLPEMGHSVVAKDGTRVIRYAADQIFVCYEGDDLHAAADVSKKLKGAGYITDQTHNWVSLDLSGALARDALARICAIDTQAFGLDASERTTMEHMGAILTRTGDDTFLLMSASSSAGSFLHAVETSLDYVS